MNILGKITVTAVLPERLRRLEDLAYNLWWSWNSEAIDLFRETDLPLWEKLEKNPVRFIREVSHSELEQKINDPEYMSMYENIINKFDDYMKQGETWFSKTHAGHVNKNILYFSAEYGLNEVLPIYSGGLGVLSGDHCKSASDLGIPFTAFGLFYRQGYFSQQISCDGLQDTCYTELNISSLPVRPVYEASGSLLHISVEMAGRIVYARIWRVDAGRVALYLLDSNTELNSESDRWITARLYGGDQETRIQQEMLLGIGGIRAALALGIEPGVLHMNEGHSAFLGLEMLFRLVKHKGYALSQARELVSSMVAFTTHTPVPAGNDVFPINLIDKYFGSYWSIMGISRHEFLDLGLKLNDSQNFNMTVLAMTLSGKRNGVSELHGSVTRNIFGNLWPGVPEDEVPVSHVTNGIHTLTWLSPSMRKLYDTHLPPDWQARLYDSQVWNGIEDVPDADIWNTHYALKCKLISFLRPKIKAQMISNNDTPENIKNADTLLDPEALTIGFARRFATYKRASLIFRNLERIRKLLNIPYMPVQLIFAGKAHPADKPAQDVLRSIHDISRQEGFTGKVVLVENYNMTISRNLVQGVDIWLNNPRRPPEASGTSGQKACINGVLNLSVLDGWWCEGYNGRNGWAIGGVNGTPYSNEENQDNADSESLYELLEKQIIPMFFNRDESGVPVKWIRYMKESIRSLSHKFSTHRMLQDYTEKMYVPLLERYEMMQADNAKKAADLAGWKQFISESWPLLSINTGKAHSDIPESKLNSGEQVVLEAEVTLGPIRPEHVKVELYYGYIGKSGTLEDPVIFDMALKEPLSGDTYRYTAEISITEGGEYGYTFRVVPYHPLLISKFNQGLIYWAI